MDCAQLRAAAAAAPPQCNRSHCSIRRLPSRRSKVRIVASLGEAAAAARTSLRPLTATEPTPAFSSARAFAPATVANLGPGYDFLGCAVDELGDYVTAELDDNVEPGQVRIASIDGDAGRLSYESSKNCAGIAGKATMDLLGVRSRGVSLRLSKGLPLGSGLGSSAASAAAAAAAVNGLFGSLLRARLLVAAGLEAEAAVSGRHADNVAPSLLGGFVLVRGMDPLDLVQLPWGGEAQAHKTGLFFVLATPEFEAPTRKMRAAVPKTLSLAAHTANCAQAATLVAAVLSGDVGLLGEALSADTIVEPARAPLIPGMAAVKRAAMAEGGALGCTISGAGPTAVAVSREGEAAAAAVGAAMVAAFERHGGLRARYSVHRLDTQGARVVETKS